MIYGVVFDLQRIQSECLKLDKISGQTNFWNDSEKAQSILKKRASHQRILDSWKKTETNLSDQKELIEIMELEDTKDEKILAEISQNLLSIENEVERQEFRSIMNSPDNFSNAILSVNAGAGGVESQDWAGMLTRMYTRWSEENDFLVSIVSVFPGDESGFKSVTLIIEGEFAYGYLRAEVGVHRLVRISPFDSNSRRHTSFASVDVSPEVNDDVIIDVSENDLRIDVFRSSGAGGQHVNTTDSAVRITHLPSGIVVSCQNERSQHKNRATAMKLLRAQLYDVEKQKLQEKKDVLHASKKSIAFGSQIRSYILHPYRMVKDHRTNIEFSNVDSVLDGKIDIFLDAYLKTLIDN